MFMLNEYTAGEITQAINRFPVKWERIGELGIFTNRPLMTRTAVIEEASGALKVLPTHEWGGAGTVPAADTRNTYAFPIKQTVHQDLILPNDIQGIRAFGTDNAMSTAAQVLAERLMRMRMKHEITLEWKRMGALKGIVTNNDGSTLVNLFTQFGVSQVEVFFDLATAGTDILGKCAAVMNQIEDNLKGDTMTRAHALVSPEFYQALISHPKVVDAYKYHAGAAMHLGTDMRKGFEFGGITFEEYRASVDGNRLIAADVGYAFPFGTQSTFETYFAPADFMEAVNTIALPFYAKIEEAEFNRGWKVHTQSNSLPICTQPAVLVKLNKAAS